MVATQTQIRRDTATNLDAATPANAELAYDTTNKRLRLGDGTTQGGTLTPNASDLQRGTFTYAVAGGTANAITLSLTPTLTGYSNGLGVRFRASANNTGSTTVTIGANSANIIQKMTVNGLADLEGGEIMNGGIYDLAYNGTNFVLLNAMQSEAAAVEFVGRFEPNPTPSRYWEFVNIFEIGYSYEVEIAGMGYSTNSTVPPQMSFSSDGGSSWSTTVYNPVGIPVTSISLCQMGSQSNNFPQSRISARLVFNNPAESGDARGHCHEYSIASSTYILQQPFRVGSLGTTAFNSFRFDSVSSSIHIIHGYANIWRKRNI